MDFLGVGPWEILLVFIVSLIILGPGKIPEIAKTLGRIIRATKRVTADFTTAVMREADRPNNEEIPSQTKDKKTVRTGQAPSVISKPSHQSRVDQPKKQKEQPADDE